MLDNIKERLQNVDLIPLLKKWWLTLLLVPVVYFHLHQAYRSMFFDLYFSYSYPFPFPVNLISLFTDGFLLLIHEAGHTFFSIFGNRILTILGGSLLEVAMPLGIVIYCYYTAMEKITQLFLFITGSAWMSVGYYAADGSLRQLPLIADLGPASHDWGNLLRHWNLTEYAWQIGFTFVLLGVIFYSLAIILPLVMKKYETEQINLKL